MAKIPFSPVTTAFNPEELTLRLIKCLKKPEVIYSFMLKARKIHSFFRF